MRLVARLALMSSFFKKNLMITRRKYSDILPEVAEGDMHKPAVLIKATLQHDGVPVWIPPQKIPRRLIGQNHPGLDRSIGRLVVEVLNDGENELADLRKQPAVVAEVRSQQLGDRPNELPVG